MGNQGPKRTRTRREHDRSESTAEDFAPHLKAEAARAWELYQEGIIRELYFRADRDEWRQVSARPAEKRITVASEHGHLRVRLIKVNREAEV